MRTENSGFTTTVRMAHPTAKSLFHSGVTVEKLIVVEVAYALPHKQKIIELQVAEGTTAYEAVVASGITSHFPEIDIDHSRMGIFGQALGTKGLKPPREYRLQPRDRVEIYRPLTIDPKEVRRRRAEKARRKPAQ